MCVCNSGTSTRACEYPGVTAHGSAIQHHTPFSVSTRQSRAALHSLAFKAIAKLPLAVFRARR